jgi:phosphate uptake regulator
MNDDTAPATKGDIHLLKVDIHRLQADMRNEVREMARGLNKAIDQVLTVLVNVDKRLTTSVADHEKRIRRLERSTGVAA